jgi:hypothetical protein
MKTKTFDCVQMKRRGAEQVGRKIKGKSRAQQLQYWKQATEQLKERQRQIQKQK